MKDLTELADFAKTGLGQLLDCVSSSRTLLDEVATRSYVHDNGFVKIILRSRTVDEGALRLHIWPPGGSEDCGNIHNHCWDFLSFVISGALEYEEFAIDEGGTTTASHLLYDPINAFEYRLRPGGQTRLRSTRHGWHDAGKAYAMSAETLHRTWAISSSTTVTLLKQGLIRREYADVYVTHPMPEQMHNVPLSSSQLSRFIGDIRGLLH